MHSTSPKPLLVRFGALGDMVILTVAIRLLNERFQSPVDILASGPWAAPLLQDQSGVGDVMVVTSRTRPYLLSLSQQAVVRQLRKRGRGPTWMGETNTTKALWLLQRAGWQSTDICGVSELPSSGMEHYCDHLVRLANLTPVSAAGVATQAPATTARPFYSLTVTPAMRELAKQWLERKGLHSSQLILIQAGNKRTMKKFGSRQRATNTKYWPETQWAAVLRTLRERHPEHAILLLGVPQEAPLNDDIIRLASIRNVHNIARDNSIPLLMALAEKATGMISVDTGPGHVAAATGCKVVTLFGQTDPRFYVPRGPVQDALPLTGEVEGKQSILGITPAQVMDAWQQLIP